MGITVAYRGRIEDLGRVEDFEDRVVDLALDVGAQVRVWRSAAQGDRKRVVRGLTVDLAPGQETTSLLVSPEGWLIGLADIEDAEEGRLAEPPWCFVKTQFGCVEGHVTLIELLDALKKEFIADLEVRDEGGYWESRDVQALAQRFARLQEALDKLAEGLRRSRLSPEAAEDPEILAARIERIARQVHQTISRPAEHAPVHFEDEPYSDDADPAGSEAQWDAMYKENRRKQERMSRAVQERMHRGEDARDALESAMRDEGMIDLPGEPEDSEGEFDWEDPSDLEDEPAWLESLPELVRDDDDLGEPRERHPLQDQAQDLMVRLHKLFEGVSGPQGGQVDMILGGAGEMMGGLAQAMSGRRFESGRGLALVQLKRALRGAAFARGALFPLRCEGLIHDDVFNELQSTINGMESEILAELSRLRAEGGRDD